MSALFSCNMLLNGLLYKKGGAFMLNGRYDMHTHTTASDGALKPAELVERAYALGLSGVAICDHDTLDGLDEAGDAVEMLNMRLIPGVELSCELARDGGTVEVHILGYFIEKAGEELMARLHDLQQHRLQRGQKILAKLAELGMPLDDLAAEYQNGGSLGRGLIGRKLVEAGYAADTDEAFDKWLSPGRAAYVPRYKLAVAEAVELLHHDGAVAVLAHPIQLGGDEVIPQIVAAGIDGIEVAHTDHSAEDEQRYRELAAKFGLAVSGGSDFHSDLQAGELGGHTADEAELAALLARYEKYR